MEVDLVIGTGSVADLLLLPFPPDGGEADEETRKNLD